MDHGPCTDQRKEEAMSSENVVVIGAGAAGLMAAAAAAEKGHKVTVYERNEKAGKKIYITGKGRCNLTNACDAEEFFTHVVRNPKFVYSAFYQYDQQRVMDFVEKNGCPVKVERGKRVFPVSDHASDVTKAFTDYLRKMHVRVIYHQGIREILTEEIKVSEQAPAPAGDPKYAKKAGKGKKILQTKKVTGLVLDDGRKISCGRVILCTGGRSYASTGSTGDGYRLAGELGHTIEEPAPSLVPLTVKEDWPIRLQGLSLKNVSVSFYPLGQEGKGKKKPVYEDFGEMLFTHFGISGPIVLTGSCYLDFRKHPEGYRLLLNLKPAVPADELEERLSREFALAPGKKLANALRSLFPQRLAEEMADLSGFGQDMEVRRLDPAGIHALAGLIQAVPVTVTGTRGFAEAIVTKGGISTKEINPSTMESKLVKGLYFAGEVIDIDAHTGGFNLQLAWSTGHLAGYSI